jgi:predicted metal-dependent hydrolase
MQYRIIRSDRKTVALQIHEGEVIVRAPRTMRQLEIAAFVKKHEAWVQKKLSVQKKSGGEPPLSNEDVRTLADRALEVIPPRVKHYAAVVGVRYNRVTIRNQKTKWGRERNLPPPYHSMSFILNQRLKIRYSADFLFFYFRFLARCMSIQLSLVSRKFSH